MSTEIKVDDDLYSRSIFTYGIDTLQKLSTMKILIIGMRGLGVETAKNIILSGPGEVDIFDPSLTTIKDLGSNFFLSEEDVGKRNRDEACLEKRANLNSYVKVGIFLYFFIEFIIHFVHSIILNFNEFQKDFTNPRILFKQISYHIRINKLIIFIR